MRRRIAPALFALICSIPLFARTPAQVKAVLESICPPDTFVKAAYLKDGSAANFATQTTGANVYVVSSEDGVVRKVNTVTGNLMMVNITADGKRVLFWNKNSERTYVVNWNGTGERVVTSTGQLLEYWRGAAGTDWALIGDNGTYRVNIDTPSTKIKISNYECGGLGGGFSDDGTRVLVFDGYWGTAATNSTSIQKGSGGCQGSMRAGPVAQWSCNESGHTNSFVNNPDGSVAFKIRIGSSTTTGEGARFTQHRNFFTYMEATGNPARARPTNPIILRVSDTVRIGIEDNIASSTFCGDVDVVFLPLPSSVSRRSPRAVPRGLAPNFRAEAFTIAGRRVSAHSSAVGGARSVVLLRNGEQMPQLRRAVTNY